MDILEFQNEYRWLSNFWPAIVELDGIFYPTVENAFQAAKTNVSYRQRFVNCRPEEAKKLGRQIQLRADWDEVKIPTMRSLIQQKFRRGTLLSEKLIATGDCIIVEGNRWGDRFWGMCNGTGKNHLGILLMEQRTFLQTQNR